jgi:hypothetical protein
MRRAPLTTLAVLGLLLAFTGPAASADAATTRSLCARTAVLRDSPEGFVIGRLHRPQRLRLQRRSANRRWALVITRGGAVGWIPARSLCRA